MNSSHTDRAFAPRRGAEGVYPTEAAVQLLINTGLVSRFDFASENPTRLHQRRADGSSRLGARMDWDQLEDSWLSSTEKACVAIARGAAILEHHGGPSPRTADPLRRLIEAVTPPVP